jgi:hypothetical protein
MAPIQLAAPARVDADAVQIALDIGSASKRGSITRNHSGGT